MEDKDPHEKQWEKIEAENLALTKEKGDIYHRRAESCRNLLNKYC